MTDNDKPATDKPVKEPEAEEPKAEEPGDDTAAPADDAATPADDAATPVGTDQRGRQLYSVKCADCGKQTQVPFKPSGDRPVYCRDCYMKKRGERAGGA